MPMPLSTAIPKHYEPRAKIMKAMAHPSRLFILDRLAMREHCVCELTDMIGGDISTVSKHLTVLRTAGLVADEKRGRQVWYTLRTPCVLGFFECVESVIRANHKADQETDAGA